MWFSVVCTLIGNDTHHHSGQNVVDSTTNFDHCDDNQIARSVAIVVQICFDICCIRLMDQSFGTPLSPGQPPLPPPEPARDLTF